MLKSKSRFINLFIVLSLVFFCTADSYSQTNQEETLVVYIPNAQGYFNYFVCSENFMAPYFQDNTGHVVDPSRWSAGDLTFYNKTKYYVDPSTGYTRLAKVIVRNKFEARVLYSNNPASSITSVFQIEPAGVTRVGNLRIAGNKILTMNAATPTASNTPKWVWVGLPDIAEGIFSKENVESSDVVVLDADNPDHVVKSTKPYDQNIAGVISESPFLYMAVSEDQKPLALVGRVKCKVCGENGAINPGDILVTSSLPGHAMKADNSKIKCGSIIGKALEKFDGNGEGKIVVLVNSR